MPLPSQEVNHRARELGTVVIDRSDVPRVRQPQELALGRRHLHQQQLPLQRRRVRQGTGVCAVIDYPPLDSEMDMMTRQFSRTYTIAPAFSPAHPMEVDATSILDVFREADRRYPEMRNPHYFAPGLGEPWKISRVLMSDEEYRLRLSKRG